jgi:hydroxyethylthiazole kinase-like sugar kinase family protein
LVERPRIAIVGARKASIEGRRRAAQLARDCARAGVVVVVVSGLAEGIDYAAHTAAIEHGGKTIAVIGTGPSFGSLASSMPLRLRSMWDRCSAYDHHVIRATPRLSIRSPCASKKSGTFILSEPFTLWVAVGTVLVIGSISMLAHRPAIAR